eukprot:TRINITY_DN17160_c0_g1_i1.p1 TRINITY_DN17160_c0_g1~~TRINITY_DN17160_c0_g1_i1.p1  ORF type:complete len:266 (-),score=70.14 TRINITY_DN17160_c0_g1_i1:11-700(-)
MSEERVKKFMNTWLVDLNSESGSNIEITLPPPCHDGTVSLEHTLKIRRSAHNFNSLKPLTLAQLSQLLWAAQGVTKIDVDGDTYHTAPSGGSMQPLDIYALIGNIPGISPGAYHYIPRTHKLIQTASGEHREVVSKLSCNQEWMARAPVIFLITGEYQRSAAKYGAAGKQYTIIEVGHVGQNIFLQSMALGLACAIIGAFQEDNIIKLLNIPQNHIPYSIMPVGYSAGL